MPPSARHSSSARLLLPVTLAALIVPLFYAVACLFSWSPAAVLSAVLVVMAVLFLLPFSLRKPKKIGKICIIIGGIFVIWFVMYACKCTL